MSLTLRTISPINWIKSYQSLCSNIERIEKRLERADAIIDILLSDLEYDPESSQGLNAQEGRKSIVNELFNKFDFEQVIETGTFFGLTSGYLWSNFEVPILTCEAVLRHYSVAKRLLRKLSGITVMHMDSRSFLLKLKQQDSLTQKNTFFYLDAHWEEDLPLAEEVEIVCQSWKKFAILIDDFCVPDDPGYGYDDYGSGKVLNLLYLSKAIRKYNLKVFFPTLPSEKETGGKRGSVLLVSETLSQKMLTLDNLRSWKM